MVEVAAGIRSHPIERRAVLAVLLAIALWSCSSLFVRAGHSDALVFTTWRLLFALPPLAVIVAYRSRHGHSVAFRPPGVTAGRWTLLLLGAGAFFAAAAGSTFIAFGMTRLLDVTLIGSLQPVLVIAFAVAFLGERAGRSHVLRAVVAVVGTVIVAAAASSSGTWSLAGDAVAVFSLVLNSAWFVYGRVLRTNFTVDPFAFMLGTFSAAVLLIVPVAAIAHGSLMLSGRGFFFAACTTLSGTTAHVLMIWAHRFVPTSISAPLLLAEAPLVAIGAWVFFGESVTVLEAIGAVIVVASLFGVARAPELERAEAGVPDPSVPT